MKQCNCKLYISIVMKMITGNVRIWILSYFFGLWNFRSEYGTFLPIADLWIFTLNHCIVVYTKKKKHAISVSVEFLHIEASECTCMHTTEKVHSHSLTVPNLKKKACELRRQFFSLNHSVLDDWKISWIKSLRWVRLNDKITTLPQVQLNTLFPMIPIPHIGCDLVK